MKTLLHPTIPRYVVLACLLVAVRPGPAQNPSPTSETAVHTVADLDQREVKLLETAKANPAGSAVMTMEDYGNDYTLLVVRAHTGDVERHQFYADQIVMKKGTITIVVGGTMRGEHPSATATKPGETLGTSVEGGKEVVLHPGDIAHIPAGVPHWVKVPPGTTATYLVFKEK